MKRPTSVRILGQVFTIEYTDDISGAVGEMIGSDKLIRIYKGLPKDELESTLLHEILHAVLFVSGMSFILDTAGPSGLEEGLVRAIENGIMPYVKLRIK